MTLKSSTKSLAQNELGGFHTSLSALTRMERLAARTSYMPSVILFGVGVMWGLHFIWERLWMPAAVTFSVFTVMGILLSRTVDKSALSRTLPGKVFISMAHPSSLLLQLFGFTTLLFGAWSRGPFYVLIGASIVLIVHAVAWNQILKLQLRRANSDRTDF